MTLTPAEQPIIDTWPEAMQLEAERIPEPPAMGQTFIVARNSEPDWWAEKDTPAAKVARVFVGMLLIALFVVAYVAVPT